MTWVSSPAATAAARAAIRQVLGRQGGLTWQQVRAHASDLAGLSSHTVQTALLALWNEGRFVAEIRNGGAGWRYPVLWLAPRRVA